MAWIEAADGTCINLHNLRDMQIKHLTHLNAICVVTDMEQRCGYVDLVRISYQKEADSYYLEWDDEPGRSFTMYDVMEIARKIMVYIASMAESSLVIKQQDIINMIKREAQQ